MKRMVRYSAPVWVLAISVIPVAALTLLPMTAPAADERPFLPRTIVTSTVPENGDVNPYGVAIVPVGFPSGGTIAPGDVLVSNFNNSDNLQGTGTTIIKFTPNGGAVSPAGQASEFFKGSFPGLTTALGVLKRGFVLVGSVSTTDGKFATIKAGPLLFLDRNGNVISPSPFTTKLDGPWDLTIDDQFDHARVFVSNVLNGTVTRLDLAITASTMTVNAETVIASGYTFQENDAALILGRPDSPTIQRTMFSSSHQRLTTQSLRYHKPAQEPDRPAEAQSYSRTIICAGRSHWCLRQMEICSPPTATRSTTIRPSPAKSWNSPGRAASFASSMSMRPREAHSGSVLRV